MADEIFSFLLLGDAVPKFSSADVSCDEPPVLSYLNKEISTSLQTGQKKQAS